MEYKFALILGTLLRPHVLNTYKTLFLILQYLLCNSHLVKNGFKVWKIIH